MSITLINVATGQPETFTADADGVIHIPDGTYRVIPLLQPAGGKL